MASSLRPYSRLSEVYDLEWGTWAGQYLDLLRSLLAQAGTPRARVLDLGCGTGALATELAREGHEVVGLDSSPEMVDAACRRAVRGTTFAVQDMAEAAWGHEFDLIACTFDAFNYLLTEARVRRFFESVSRLLAPAGLLVFDANGEDLYRSRHHGTLVKTLGEQRIRQVCRYDPEARLAETRFVFEDGTEELHFQRPWGLEELRAPIGSGGLEVLAAYSSPSGEAHRAGDERLVCVCRRAIGLAPWPGVPG